MCTISFFNSTRAKLKHTVSIVDLDQKKNICVEMTKEHAPNLCCLTPKQFVAHYWVRCLTDGRITIGCSSNQAITSAGFHIAQVIQRFSS